MTVPVISITDLYHPPEDPGDNVDLIMAYGLPEIDLRAVILDVLEEKRHLVDGGVPGYAGPRDPGVVAVTQLNAIFGRDVPFAWCPFTRMQSPNDRMYDVPPSQQRGVDLLINAVADSPEPVHLLSFGSARPLALAFNRAPDVLREKVARIHLSAGTTTPTYPEWNVVQDPQAMIRIIDSGLPISLYRCAADDGVAEHSCYGYDNHNTFWRLPDLKWIADMHPWLRRYLGYALGRSTRPDFLRVLEEEAPAEQMAAIYQRSHSVWETAVWMEVSGRKLVRREDGSYAIVPGADVRDGDTVIRNEQVPCTVRSHPSGLYTFELGEGSGGRTSVFVRDDPFEYEQALVEAMPALYQSFRPCGLS
ncbi:hypothetical protein HPO96_23495 [Kribbella sandramycini]|uniref:Inosine/uridine-preferring nucleoside hydrolase domain-containing protein n=1 Tax=Kribbella sandramycini TaxID=60450 RepID=A0A7Y4L2Q1_9ACTN|nr:nucleoside hydrolase [Kribbella sandramycini]MBB6571386.1 hypothetical protein [Kribbella sandramycini]NOL43214.1 hypothetical protein [Kribbella sandramycini]